MMRLPRPRRKWFSVFALAMAAGSVPASPFHSAEKPLTTREGAVLEEYRLHCQPGGYIEDVKANLETMQRLHPRSAFLKDSAFLADVHYFDWGSLRNSNGEKPPGWVHDGMFDSIFNSPSHRVDWRYCPQLDMGREEEPGIRQGLLRVEWPGHRQKARTRSLNSPSAEVAIRLPALAFTPVRAGARRETCPLPG